MGRRAVLGLVVSIAVVVATAATLVSGSGPAAGGTCGGCRLPPATASWQWQLDGTLDLSVAARVYELDGFDTSARAVARLRRAGRYAVCYVSVGTWEDWRPDRDRFPPRLLGAENGWPGERWLDIRQRALLAPIVRARFAMCHAKGFDAVEPDNVDAYANDSGFPLSAEDQLAFNRRIARLAHAEGLAVALKNDLDQARALVRSFDFAVVEQCFEYRECGKARPFLRAGKGVYDAEYALPRAAFCPAAERLGINAIRKRLVLGAWRRAC